MRNVVVAAVLVVVTVARDDRHGSCGLWIVNSVLHGAGSGLCCEVTWYVSCVGNSMRRIAVSPQTVRVSISVIRAIQT